MLVPGMKLSALLQAFSKVSCSRSSAWWNDPESETAKARRSRISRIKPSRNAFDLASVGCSLSVMTTLTRFELGQQHQQPIGQRHVRYGLKVRLQRFADRLRH